MLLLQKGSPGGQQCLPHRLPRQEALVEFAGKLDGKGLRHVILGGDDTGALQVTQKDAHKVGRRPRVHAGVAGVEQHHRPPVQHAAVLDQIPQMQVKLAVHLKVGVQVSLLGMGMAADMDQVRFSQVKVPHRRHLLLVCLRLEFRQGEQIQPAAVLQILQHLLLGAMAGLLRIGHARQ